MNIEEFIATQIGTVDHLRVLLLLQSNPQMSWAAPEIGGKLYLTERVATAVLAELTARGLLMGEGHPARYRFQPQSAERAELVRQLADLDQKHPVTLINMIYAGPKELRAFADAFRLKREKGN